MMGESVQISSNRVGALIPCHTSGTRHLFIGSIAAAAIALVFRHLGVRGVALKIEADSRDRDDDDPS